MKTNNNGCICCGCAITGAIAGIIFGAAIGVLFAFGFIPFIVTATWIAFGLAAAVLLYIMGVVVLNSCGPCSRLSVCLCRNLNCLLVGALGTIILALAALAITLTITVTSIIILVAIGAFFFAFMITALIYFIECLVCCPS